MNHRTLTAATLAISAGLAHAGPPGFAWIVEGSGFFGAPGIELAQVGVVNLADPSNAVIAISAGENLRFGGADFRPGTGEFVAFENTTNAMRVIDLVDGGNTLMDSIGFMEPGVGGLAFSNDGSIAYATTTVGGFVRVVQADADNASVLSVHNILTDSVSSLAVVPEGHQTLTPGDLYGLALTATGSLRLVQLDLDANTVASSRFVSGIGFNPQFETGLDFAGDGTLWAAIQGFDEVAPDVFVEISSHLFTIDPSTGAATDVGVIQADETWDAVTLVVDDPDNPCLPDLVPDGQLDFFDISAFVSLLAAQDPRVDFNDDGHWDFFDVSIFLNAFAAGCP